MDWIASANGDGSVLALPTASNEYPWVVLRRVEAGSVFVPHEERFACDNYQKSAVALAHFGSLSSTQSPIMVTVSGGTTLVAYLKSQRPRAVRR